MNTVWSNEEIKKLKEIFSDNKNIEISHIMNRSIKSITKKSNLLGLKKSKEHKSKIITLRNKIIGRDLNYKKLKEISMLYRTRSQFQLMDSSAYQIARKLNILDDICSHMIKQSFSIPQLILNYILSQLLGDKSMYNTRKIIKPYELDIYFPEYKLAFEYNGRRWHENDKINKQEICKEKGIKLFTLVENNRKYEEDIKNQLINIINELNIITNKNILENDIKYMVLSDTIFNNILDEEKIINICNNYNNYTEFIKSEKKIYEKIIKLGLIDKYTKHMKKRNIWSDDNAILTIYKFEYLGDFIKDNYGCYQWIKRNKKEYLLKNLKLKQNKNLKYS